MISSANSHHFILARLNLFCDVYLSVIFTAPNLTWAIVQIISKMFLIAGIKHFPPQWNTLRLPIQLVSKIKLWSFLLKFLLFSVKGHTWTLGVCVAGGGETQQWPTQVFEIKRSFPAHTALPLWHDVTYLPPELHAGVLSHCRGYDHWAVSTRWKIQPEWWCVTSGTLWWLEQM